MNKPTLFYSERCEFSREIRSTLQKNSVIDNYTLVNVDNNDQQIPSFVDRVPLLFHNNKVLHDEGLFNYIENILAKSESIKAFTLDTNLTDTFSFISEENSDEFVKQYLKVSNGEFTEQKIDTPVEVEETKKTQSIEELMFTRENEVKNI